MSDRLQQLAAAIRADLAVRDDEGEDELVVQARRRIAGEYQTLTAAERTELHGMLQSTPATEATEASPDAQELMATLKRHGPRRPPKPAPKPRAPEPQRRVVTLTRQHDPLKWDEWTPSRPSSRVAFRNHAFDPLGPPEISWVAKWCQRCGRDARAHAVA